MLSDVSKLIKSHKILRFSLFCQFIMRLYSLFVMLIYLEAIDKFRFAHIILPEFISPLPKLSPICKIFPWGNVVKNHHQNYTYHSNQLGNYSHESVLNIYYIEYTLSHLL